MDRRVKLFVILTVIITLASTSDILDYGYVDHIECNISKEYCSNSTCKLSFQTRRVKQLNWSCFLNKKVDIVHVLVTLYYRYRVGYQQFLIDVNTDFCAYHDNQAASAILDLVKLTFKNHSQNLWDPCPYLPGRNLAVKKLPLTSVLVQRLFVPAGEYKLNIETRVGQKYQTSSSPLTTLSKVMLFINIPAGRTIEDDKMG